MSARTSFHKYSFEIHIKKKLSAFCRTRNAAKIEKHAVHAQIQSAGPDRSQNGDHQEVRAAKLQAVRDRALDGREDHAGNAEGAGYRAANRYGLHAVPNCGEDRRYSQRQIAQAHDHLYGISVDVFIVGKRTGFLDEKLGR